ncbi:hypothetical protein [Chryseobacterium rhizosphaerae]|uniref:Uncharacterized protein n=1 Tax=Chryseobacterium rhizosphaerae TaxID=395937 RepID=A0ABX9IKH2_9FLAO|nr:hypothetical protein [Chryseobacterium rhizosphaerae]REC74864.1 hypothetical protein DRF57_12570 [Chryseobacterium rhizosphaerae]GEN67791.1 hypothetical protein CRH01_23590 [Chryseobacterium rhizosphaerae]
MIKKILVFIVLFWNFFSFAQEIKPVARKIHEYEKLNYRAPRYGLFDVKNLDNMVDLRKIATDATIFGLDQPKLKRLMAESPEFLEVSFPFDGDKEITVQLYKKQIFTADLK